MTTVIGRLALGDRRQPDNENTAMEVVFRAIYPWAVLPRKIKIDAKAKEAEARMFEEQFRWIRISRSAELCWPWRLGQELGWVIDSPVTIAMDALHDVEAMCPPADNRALSVAANCTEAWSFKDDQGNLQRAHYTRYAGWVGLYDFRNGDHYERMFYINGQGSVEWVLGWEMRIPPQYFAMLLPYEHIPNLEVLVGLIDHKNLKKPGKSGLSIAIRPTGPVQLRRGQPIARVILLHGDSLRFEAKYENADAKQQHGTSP
jgi:hypothetical protein